ncbi:acyltransferase family protein [Neptunomonas marina]|uniref:Acyltransferase n=1 Tax=Neptunomonas marina TaxID=1815562 RepID=A0A437Q4I3_9GAMM|nr:acyltransferase [Neptunomonas marina]RVU29333.1 acyltransferase [Neptunomonas marina]
MERTLGAEQKLAIHSAAKSVVTPTQAELVRIDYLDGWRGIAILFVLLEHFFDVTGIHVGRMGVDIFFVLSGMLMSNILFVKKVPLRTFYKRRISRIFPVFLLFVTSLSLCSLIFELSHEHNNYLYNLLFLRSYYPEHPSLWNTGLPIGHFWSLNVEEHSYVVLSVVAVLALWVRRVYLIVLTLGVSCIVTHFIYVKNPGFAPANFEFRTEVVASFLLISAGYFLVKNRFERFLPAWSPLVSFVLAIACYSPYSPHWSFEWSVAPFLLAFTVNHLNLLPNFVKSVLSIPALRLLGIWSFSIYLWQQPFYYYGIKFGEAFPLAGVTLFSLAILTGALSFYLIENPARKFLNERW